MKNEIKTIKVLLSTSLITTMILSFALAEAYAQAYAQAAETPDDRLVNKEQKLKDLMKKYARESETAKGKTNMQWTEAESNYINKLGSLLVDAIVNAVNYR